MKDDICGEYHDRRVRQTGGLGFKISLHASVPTNFAILNSGTVMTNGFAAVSKNIKNKWKTRMLGVGESALIAGVYRRILWIGKWAD